MDMKFLATPPVHGSLADYHIHAAQMCFKLPDNVSFEEGAMCEPLSVGLHACSRGEVTVGSQVLIMGAGPIGCVSYLAAKAAGATLVVVVDVREDRLAFAKEKLGVDYVFQAKPGTAETMLQEMKALTVIGHGFDVAIECTGAPPAIANAMKATKNGGKVVLVGLGPSEATLPILDAATREGMLLDDVVRLLTLL